MIVYNSSAYETEFVEDGTKYLAEGHYIDMDSMRIVGESDASKLTTNENFARVESVIIRDAEGIDVTRNYSTYFPFCMLKISS